eukprot:12903723-Prorocentrum_lima.AAC.1
METLARVAECAKDLLRSLTTAENGPVLMPYSSDGTPLSSKTRVGIEVGSSTQHRSGRTTG